MKRKIVYIIMTLLSVFFAVIVLLKKDSITTIKTLIHSDFSYILIFFLLAVSVHIIKMIRMCCILAGKSINIITQIKQYCKSVPISMLIPFKLGEIYKMYCYGYTVKNYYRGTIIVILDRFVDTLALLSASIVIHVVELQSVTYIEYFLLLFLIIVMVCYSAFPSIYSYWNSYLLHADTTLRNIKLLKLLDKVNSAYSEISHIVKNRFFILYILSLFAWIVESGGLFVVCSIFGENANDQSISNYFISSLLGGKNVYLQNYIICSCIFLGALYIFVLIKNSIQRKDK